MGFRTHTNFQLELECGNSDNSTRSWHCINEGPQDLRTRNSSLGFTRTSLDSGMAALRPVDSNSVGSVIEIIPISCHCNIISHVLSRSVCWRVLPEWTYCHRRCRCECGVSTAAWATKICLPDDDRRRYVHTRRDSSKQQQLYHP
jgi:hypothetical protein